MSTPVPQTFAMKTSPILTGASTVTLLISFITSKIAPLGMGPDVLQGTTGCSPFDTLTVEWMDLTGFEISVLA